MSKPGKRLKKLYCEKLGRPEDSFEKTLLLACLPPQYRLAGLLRWHLNPAYFEPDLEIIGAVADCTSLQEVEDCYKNHQKAAGLQRGWLRFRITRSRLRAFAQNLLKTPGE